MNRFRVFVAAAALLGSSFVSEAAAPSCDITFRIGYSGSMRSASVFVIYQNAPGEFAGSNTAVDCDLGSGFAGVAADADQTRTLTLSANGVPNAFTAPRALATCRWIPTSRFPILSDFNISGQLGSDGNFSPVNANITITTIECSGDISTTTTTTTSTTTTTLAQLCGDFDNNGTMQTSDALNVLKASVGQKPCALCVCDLDGNGSKAATDALLGLRSAVGLAVQLKCPACN
jgi:hypothetical protein